MNQQLFVPRGLRARCTSRGLVLAAVGLCLLVGMAGTAVADIICEGSAVVVPRTRKAVRKNQAVSTVVHGLYLYDSNPTFPRSGQPLAEGDSVSLNQYAIALEWSIEDAQHGQTWSQRFNAPGGGSLQFDVLFTFDAAQNRGCVRITTIGSQTTVQTYCLPDARSWDLTLSLHSRCSAAGTWTVGLLGPDAGASYARDFRVHPTGTSLVLIYPPVLQTHLPQENPGGASFAPAVPGGSANVAVAAVDSLCPNVLIPARLRLQAEYDPASGGHTHQASASPTAEHMNRILPAPLVFSGTGWDASTGRFTATDEIAGAKITAGVASCTIDWTGTLDPPGEDKVEASTRIRIAETLVEMPSGTAYVLDGGLGQPCGQQEFCDRHDANHFLTPALAVALDDFAQIYYAMTFDTYRLGFNDMSLVDGGVFDVNGDFKPSHHYHRRGWDVDVVFRYDVNNVRQGFRDRPAVKAEIDEAASIAGLVKVIEPQLHYRLP